jgi:nucleotide-binding universal stress UspA family protein
MYHCILVPIDLTETELAKPAISAAVIMAPVMLAEYVPPDFETQQRKSAEDALSIVCKESGLDPSKVSATVRQGGIYQEILEEAKSIKADLIVMSSHRKHRPGIRTYFLGSHTGHVVRYAQCSVLVVRQ